MPEPLSRGPRSTRGARRPAAWVVSGRLSESRGEAHSASPAAGRQALTAPTGTEQACRKHAPAPAGADASGRRPGHS